MSAVAASTSFSTMVYDRIVKNSLSYEIWDKAAFSTSSDNTDIIKLAAAKGAMIPILCLAITETAAKVALGIFSYGFSLITFFIPSVSNRSYVLAKDLLGELNQSTASINRAIVFFFFGRPLRSDREGVYGVFICTTLTWNGIRLLEGYAAHSSYDTTKDSKFWEGYFAHSLFDTKCVTILKNIAYKLAYLGVIPIAPIEWMARACLSLVAYSFSVIAAPIEWMLEAPFSSLYYRAVPGMPISRMVYQISCDLFSYNYGVARTWGCAVNNVLLERNQLTKGLLD